MGKNVGLVIMGVGMFLIVLGFTMGSSLSNLFTQKNKIVCDITVSKKLGYCDIILSPILCQILGTHVAYISNYNCRTEGSCMFGFSAVPMGVITDNGFIKLSSGGSASTTPYSVTLLLQQDQTKQMSICSSSNNYQITLLDNNNNVLETKTGVVS